MPDSWQPTILRLVPFSSNNARAQDKTKMAKPHSHIRNFPMLAVTRNSANSDTRTETSVSGKSEAADDASVISEANLSIITTNTAHTARSSARKQKYAKKKIPDSHSTMKEALKFSVQDLNDQMSSVASLHTPDIKEENEQFNKYDYTRTKLPKPSMCHSPDARYCSPVNGVRRSVPLTPGEMELQRIRENYYVEQVQKRKKYKLNINQLPRSTTPINDHDPDKLNMKQVIAFLQTKTSQDVQKKILNDKRENVTSPKKSENAISISTDPVSSPRKVYAKDNVKPLSRSNTEITFNGNATPDNMRVNTGCASVMSTKSSPNTSNANKTHTKSEKLAGTRSVRSFRDRQKERKNVRQKPIKEFKLFRFLAVAPESRTEGLSTTFTEPGSMSQMTENETKTVGSSRKILSKRSSRDCDTAHVLRRHAVNRSHITPPKLDVDEDKSDQTKPIKLPVMTDADNRELQDADSDTCSTTSATCNSTKFSATTMDRSSLPKKGKSLTFDDNIDVNITVKSPPQHESGYNDFVRAYKSPSFPKVNISGPKQIHVSLPQENKKTYSQEIVRLTLRQDKNTTRVTSYMSDLEQNLNSRWHEQYSGDETDEGISSMTSSNHTTSYENREWMEHSKQLISTIANNNFIKVRQKLKASHVYNTE